MSALLEVRDLRVRFRVISRLRAVLQRHSNPFIDAVAGMSFAIETGQTYALVGESGSGKSTAARAINKLIAAEQGSHIVFDGVDITSLSESEFKASRRHMSMMFQDPIGSLSPRLTVRSLLVEPFYAHGLVDDRDIGAECRRLLDMVGLHEAFADRYPHELSGGQARRIGVARALALDPKLIIADEPTAGLDVSVQGDVLNLLNDLQERLGLTILIITHNLQVVRHFAQRTAIMYLGRLVEEGPTDRIFAQPRHPYTKALLSASPKPDPDAVRSRIELRGDIPSLKNRPRGCEFHPRCPYSRDDCCRSRPHQIVEQNMRRYTCFHPLFQEHQ